MDEAAFAEQQKVITDLTHRIHDCAQGATPLELIVTYIVLNNANANPHRMHPVGYKRFKPVYDVTYGSAPLRLIAIDEFSPYVARHLPKPREWHPTFLDMPPEKIAAILMEEKQNEHDE